MGASPSDSLGLIRKALCIANEGIMPMSSFRLVKPGNYGTRADEETLAALNVSNRAPTLELVATPKAGFDRLEPTLLEAVAKTDRITLQIQHHITPVLALAVPCQLSDDMDGIWISRLARLLWNIPEAAELIGHIYETFWFVRRMPGATLNDRVRYYLALSPL